MSNKQKTKVQIPESKLADKWWRLSHLYKIKTKSKKLETLTPNKVQERYFAMQTSRDEILKARQMGFSTWKLIELLDYAITTPNVNCCVIAHKRDTVTILFEIIHLAYKNLPDHPSIKPRTSYNNRNELYFPDLNSKIFVALDTRGQTVHNLHVSEVAFVENAEEKMLGILEAVPKDGIISFETTANGMSGYFYDTWEDSHSEFSKHFYNWMWDDEYREPTKKSWDELIAEYEVLQIRYGLIPNCWSRFKMDREQFNFYIKKCHRHRQMVMQEYPLTAQEAFISSGRNVFHMSDLQKQVTQDPIERKWGSCFIWERPMKGFKYSIGCDPAEGVGGDYSVISVWNSDTGEQVAEYADNNVKPDDLAGILIELGNYYNKAFIVLEINNHGITVMDHIKHQYFNLYRRQSFDKRTNEWGEALGWKTSVTTKPRLVDDIEEALRGEDIMIRSEDLIKEMKTFVKTEEVGKTGYGAEGNYHDDRVIAAALAIQGIKVLPKMKRPLSEAESKLKEYMEAKRAEIAGMPRPLHPRRKMTTRIRNSRIQNS